MSDLQSFIRNFAIVAHIDHGKSTLADRLLEATGTIELRKMQEQILDSNPIERERGITIKLAPVRMNYTLDGNPYILNLIDTPGHVDFSYEVSRSLAACEGVLLVVDATQGIQAQTVAHMTLIKDKHLKVIPVINKIDLPTAKVEELKETLTQTFGFDANDIIEISAKSGINIDKVLRAIIEKIPPPKGDTQAPLKALVFSSQYDIHRGVIVYVRIMNGDLSIDHFHKAVSKTSDVHLKFFATNASFIPIEFGVFAPKLTTRDRLLMGEVGFIATGLKELNLARVGDTVYFSRQTVVPLEGYIEPKPMVYVSLFPTDNDDFPLLREALEKLHLSDSSFTFKLHSSMALGKGFLSGFLGLLHAEVVKERLEREFNLSIIATSPTVEYKIETMGGKTIIIQSPDDFPDPSTIRTIMEPIMLVTIFAPAECVGPIMQLTQEKRSEYVNLEYVGTQAKFSYLIPLSEMIIDFFDKLKSATSGYASLDYEFYEYRSVEAVKLEVLINRKPADAFSQIVVKDQATTIGNKLVEKLKTLIPRHQFQIPIQAAIGGKIVARADISSFRKDVTAKLYGGDQTRKDKLLEAQRKGKKKMRAMGNVNIPQSVFLEVYKSN